MDGGAWPWGSKESVATERLAFSLPFQLIYVVGLVSSTQQNDSVAVHIYVYISILFQILLH